MPNDRMMYVLAISCVLAVATDALGQDAAGATRDDRDLRRTPVVEVFEANRDSVVNIASTRVVEDRGPFLFGSPFDDLFDMPSPFRGRRYARTSMGSGFVLHRDGYIITNAHVVARTVERKVIFADGREIEAEIVAIDVDRDLAMLKIDTPDTLPAVTLGRSDDLMVGETVIAIGNPLGFQHTVTSGVVSATGRDLDFAGGISLEGLIQTDASINPGNSGGPLLNILGELIGVNTAIRGDAQNIGFAIAVDQLREVLPDLLDIERRYRIVTGFDVDTLGRPEIVRLDVDSPADRAGVEVGDLLEAVDDTPIEQGVDYYIAMIGREPGERIRLRVRRGEESRDMVVRLGERPRPDGTALAWSRLGLRIRAVTEDEARELNMPDLAGMLVVTEVERRGPGARAGEIVVAIDRHSVGSLDRLGQLLEQVRSGATVAVTALHIRVSRSMQQINQVRRDVQAR